MTRKTSTSWEPVEDWYKAAVGKEGHTYHKEVVLPGLLKLIKAFKPKCDSLVDLACGQGVLARNLPPQVRYVGVDLSPSLVTYAKNNDKQRTHRYFVGDITDPKLDAGSERFDCCTIVLAIQNVENALAAFQNAARFLKDDGKLFIVMNHPSFRIPRQSSWGVDEQKKLQYRRMEGYMSAMKIPIQMHPSKGDDSAVTISFHHPLSSYAQWLQQAGFCIETMEEWCSTKESTGRTAKMENRSRKEFPLFLTLVARK
ncbi:MAG: class I SAM-dependent methyltransferase [Chlamydiales bacterium]|nr:class I SAM-dependent methyltransferase [Chlamydiales bacterium]